MPVSRTLTVTRMSLLALTATLALCTPARGQDTPSPKIGPPLDAEAFAERVTGRTFFYSSAGKPYGTEQYLSDHRVIWAFTGDDCKRGRWYEKAGLICFAYEGDPEEQCWTFHDGPQGLTAYFHGDPNTVPLIALQQSPAPMACMGPDVGV